MCYPLKIKTIIIIIIIIIIIEVGVANAHEILALMALAQMRPLTHISLVSFLWDIGKQQNAASDQVLHCLLTEVSFKI